MTDSSPLLPEPPGREKMAMAWLPAGLAIILLAAVFRLLPFWYMPSATGGLTGGPDAFYHYRRAELAAHGALSDFDRWSNIRNDAIHWPQSYDRLLGLLYGAVGLPGLRLVPVVAGVAAVALMLLLGSRLAVSWGWYAALLYAITPAAVFPTVYGAIDHHCLEGLALIMIMAAFVTGGLWPWVLGVGALAVGVGGFPAWPLLVVVAAAAAGLRQRRAVVAELTLAGAFIFIPVIGAQYWLDPWLSNVTEAKPLLTSGIDLFRAVVVISPGLLFLPWAMLQWWRRRREPGCAALLAAAAVALPLTLLEKRFALYLAVPAVFAVAEGVAWFWRQRWRTIALVVAVAVVLPPLRGLAEIPAWDADPSPARAAVLGYLRTGTPPPGNYLAPETEPVYRVAAPWHWGHHITALGHRAVVANPFHTCVEGRLVAHSIFFGAPGPATALADAEQVRYLVLPDLVATGYAGRYHENEIPLTETLFYKLFVQQDNGCGWRLAYSYNHSPGGDADAIQVWEREAVF